MVTTSAFPLDRAIDRHPLTVTRETPALHVVMLMSQGRASCVLVVEQQQLIGIFTERDVVRVTAAGIALEEVAIASVMTTNIITLPESQAQDILAVISLLRQYHIRHIPLVDEKQCLVGILSHESMREVLQPADLLKLRTVSEVMSKQVIQASLTTSVIHLTQLMSSNHVSCVVIVTQDTDNSRPVGIVTERDIVQLRALGVDLMQTLAEIVMSSPLVPIHPQNSLWAAHEKMRQYRIRRLVVVDDIGKLLGIVTQTSMVQILDPMETYAALEALQKVVEVRTTDLQKANEQLHYEIIERQQIETALRVSQARLAGILDSADEAIICVDERGLIQIFNQGAEQIFGYTSGEILNNTLDLLLSETLIGASCQYNQPNPSLQSARKIGGYREIFGRRRDGTEFPAEASISESLAGDELIFTVILRDITERKIAEQALKNQIAKERLMGTIAQRIRQSLNLKLILNTTVAEVRQFLQADRVIIYSFEGECDGVVVVESIADDCISLLGNYTLDFFCVGSHFPLYKQGQFKIINDVNNSELKESEVKIFNSLKIKSDLIVPILRGEDLWGLLAVHQCSNYRQWQQLEIDLIQQLATQVGIAIQQAQLYEELQIANQELQGLANTDGLTRVANRRCFDETLQLEWRRLAREQLPLSLIICDVDFFKIYNDTYGHQAGDECLQRVAGAIRLTVKRPADLVARYGGEEFVIVLPNTDSVGAKHLADEIHFRVKLLQIPHEKSPMGNLVTLSLGVSTIIPDFSYSPEMLLAAADKALYQAKSEGRDRIIFKLVS
ncbi:diguanylate cyclase with PAS/PAC, CBS and GAF sensors [Crinalium epipsammum PCC 9333]|uniref:Diguanylate cyclase with PAS/PAC, CBS and GAF sensors n=1 Tax=Crinalium epipsammum PCC 9333 TaxID=1173022 RepID=K9VUA7_9CYAN|nr:diguanylate cyclase [Crinalium epipsammum]AFZ11042.1 diguanylate cyclase with PAS/PAC, CBS and GAF sensors [Crinalium epipsammum PCC 9333]